MRNYQWYRVVKNRGWWKVMSFLASPGDEMEISVRWRYTKVRPYTKQTYNPYLRRWFTSWGTDMNTERLPYYNRLDLMIVRRWLFERSALVAYIDIMNVFGRKNIWWYDHKNDGTKEAICMTAYIKRNGYLVNHKRVEHLMCVMNSGHLSAKKNDCEELAASGVSLFAGWFEDRGSRSGLVL